MIYLVFISLRDRMGRGIYCDPAALARINHITRECLSDCHLPTIPIDFPK